MIAYHSIFSMYGFWLPNDPRGSGSDYIAVWDLFRYGPATKTDARRSVAAVEHDAALRRAAKEALKFPPVALSGAQALAVVQGGRPVWGEHGWNIYLDEPPDVWRAIRYVEQNPLKEGKRLQR